jgi:hypothetical protein
MAEKCGSKALMAAAGFADNTSRYVDSSSFTFARQSFTYCLS